MWSSMASGEPNRAVAAGQWAGHDRFVGAPWAAGCRLMPMTAHRITTTAGALLATVTLVAAPAAALAAGQDLRSPDARDAAAAAQKRQDLRSPDARDAAAAATRRQDLRSPDAPDAADRRPVIVQVPVSPDTGFEWDSAAIGALAGVGLMLSIAGGGVLIVRRRPRAPRPA